MKLRNYITLPLLAIGLMVSSTSCKKDKDEPVEPTPTTPAMMSSTFNYEFNNGQVVAAASYDGEHSDRLTAMMKVDELSATQSRITVTLTRTVNGEMYHMHAHDAADPATTPNGTPYNETPNADVFSQMVTGNGGEVTVSQTVNMTYSQIVNDYNGFFVVHDPLQAISTTDISTYLVVGTFARAQASSGLSQQTFDIAFNTGQVAAIYAYAGSHTMNSSAHVRLQELANGSTRVSVHLHDVLDGELYHIHSHDFADPATTPNGTPYNETPNGDVLSMAITASGTTAGASQISPMSFDNLTTVYEGFFVVHDPLVALSTTDPTTYIFLSQFARN